MKVKDPSGQTWRVTRRWVPWRRRGKGALDSIDGATGWDFPDLGDDPISLIIGIVLLVLLLPVVILALLIAAEFLLLLLLLPFAVLARMVFGRKWAVEVRRGFTPVLEESVGDWQASGLRIHELADTIRRGDVPVAPA